MWHFWKISNFFFIVPAPVFHTFYKDSPVVVYLCHFMLWRFYNVILMRCIIKTLYYLHLKENYRKKSMSKKKTNSGSGILKGLLLIFVCVYTHIQIICLIHQIQWQDGLCEFFQQCKKEKNKRYRVSKWQFCCAKKCCLNFAALNVQSFFFIVIPLDVTEADFARSYFQCKYAFWTVSYFVFVTRYDKLNAIVCPFLGLAKVLFQC